MQPAYLLYEHTACAEHRERFGHVVIHWSNIGDDILVRSGFVHSYNAARMFRSSRGKIGEYGLDALAIDANGVYHGIQVKLRSSSSLRAEDLGTFLSVIFNRLRPKHGEAQGYLYTNARLEVNLRDDLKNGGVIHHVHLNLTPAIGGDCTPCKQELRDYQVEGLRAILSDNWSGFGVLSMPCGTGKTLVYGHAARAFDRVLILSPTRVAALQNHDVVGRLLQGRASLLVDSDACSQATRDPRAIAALWSGTQAFISATFCSAMDVIQEAIWGMASMENAIIIVDEAHNMSRGLQEILEASHASKILLCTATPPSYLADENPVWGRSIFHYRFADAISANWICDYEVRVPLIENLDAITEHNRLAAQAEFVADGLMRTGTRRCIVYCSSKQECDAFLGEFSSVMHLRHAVNNVWCKRLTDDTSARTRLEWLTEFQTRETICVLASVRILDEAVDLPACDSVAILHPSDKQEAWRRFIQRMMRAGRKCADNPGKIARVFLWLESLERMPQCFDMLKEQDPQFFAKIRPQGDVYVPNGDTETSAHTKEADATQFLQAHFRVSALTREEIREWKIQQLLSYYDTNKQWPPQTFKDGDWKIGGFWSDVKHGHTKISDGQRQAIQDKDPTAFDIRATSQAAKTLSTEQKIERVLQYFEEHKRWPPNRCKDGDWPMGSFWHNVKHDGFKITDAQRERILGKDPKAFDIRATSQAARTLSVEQKIERVLKYFEEHKKWPVETFKVNNWHMGSFWKRVKQGGVKISDAQRGQILDKDPGAFTTRKRSRQSDANAVKRPKTS